MESIDSVFVRAISTIRTLTSRPSGLARPSPENRARLYGLYKQATEGDIKGLLPRPTGSGPDDESGRAKWDAWKRHEGLSKVEAKKRYIELLIETMKRHATGTAEGRQMLADLEESWARLRKSPETMSASSDFPVPYGQYLGSSAMSVRSVSRRGGQAGSIVGSVVGARATPSEFGLSTRGLPDGGIVLPTAASDVDDDFAGDRLNERFTDRNDELRNWKRDVTWALETINEEMMAIRQRYMAAPLPAAGPIIVTGGTGPHDDGEPHKGNNYMDVVSRVFRHIIIDAAIIIVVGRLVRWARQNPRRLGPYSSLAASVSRTIAYLLGILGIRLSV